MLDLAKEPSLNALPASDPSQYAKHFLAMQRASADAILLVHAGALLSNPAASALLGWSTEDIATRGLEALFDMGDPKLVRFFERLREDGYSSADVFIAGHQGPPFLVHIDGSAFTGPDGTSIQILQVRPAGGSHSFQGQQGEIGLRAVADTLPDMFWIKDTAGAYLLCNQVAEQYTGYKEADLLGKTDFDIADVATAEARRLRDAGALIAGVPVHYEQWGTFRSDGHRALLAATIAPMRATDGRVVGVLGIARDVTETKRHESLLEGGNAALAKTVRGEPLLPVLDEFLQTIEALHPSFLCSVLLLDSQGLHLQLGASPSLPEAFNAAIDGVAIGSQVGSCGTAAYTSKPVFVSDIATDPLWADYRDLALTHGLRACWSAPILAASGEVLGTFALYSRQISKASAGDIKLMDIATAIAGIAIESSRVEQQRRSVAEQLRDDQTRLALALQGSETGVWDRDLRTRVVNYSNEWKALFGFDPSDVPLRNGYGVGHLHAADVPHVKQLFQDHLQGKSELYAAEHRVRCKDGSYKWVVSRGKVVDWDAQGVPLRVIGTTTDISDMKALTDELREGRDLMTNLTNEVPGLIFQCLIRADGSAYFPYASEGIRSIYELTPEQVAHDTDVVLALIHEDDREGFVSSLREASQALQAWHYEYRVILPRQGLCWRLANAKPRKLADGSVLWHGFVTDISERRALEMDIRDSEEKYRAVTENSPDAIVRYDMQLRRIFVNQVYERISGSSAVALLGKKPEQFLTIKQETTDLLQQTLQTVLATGQESDLEVTLERQDHPMFFHTRVIPEFDKDGKIKGAVTFSRDITERKILEGELQRLATTDFLTGLPNRRLFVSRIEDELARIQRLGGAEAAVLMIDLDHFKMINDQFGHQAGDQVLKNFATIVRQVLRKIDMVGRVGGEEFAIVLPSTDVQQARILAERLRANVEQARVMQEGQTLAVTISIGIAAIERLDANADAALTRADKALYQAKIAGRNRVALSEAAHS